MTLKYPAAVRRSRALMWPARIGIPSMARWSARTTRWAATRFPFHSPVGPWERGGMSMAKPLRGDGASRIGSGAATSERLSGSRSMRSEPTTGSSPAGSPTTCSVADGFSPGARHTTSATPARVRASSVPENETSGERLRPIFEPAGRLIPRPSRSNSTRLAPASAAGSMPNACGWTRTSTPRASSRQSR